MRRITSFLCIFILAVSGSDPAAAVTWDGSCGSVFWHTVCQPGSHTNWMPDGIPGPGDDVTLSRTDPVVVNFGGIADASSISCQSGLSVTNGGQLFLHGTGGVVRNLSLTNSSVRCETAGTSLTLSGTFASNGASVFGPGEVINGATLGGLSLTVRSFPGGPATFRNFNEATLTSLVCESGASFVNGIGGVLTLTPNGIIGSSINGSGSFINEGGLLVVQHNGSTSSSCSMQAHLAFSGGFFHVQGAGTTSGVTISGGAVVDGTSIEVNDDNNLRFQTGGSGFYEIGKSSITGEGNVFIQLGPFPGPEWRITAPTTVNLTGSNGLVMESGPVGIGAGLTNTGKALWKGSTIRTAQCTECVGLEFRNESPDFVINTGASSNTVTLDASFLNTNDGIVTQFLGNLSFDNNGLFTNFGEYQLIRGDFRLPTPQGTGEFINAGLLIKPDDPLTTDSIISALFALNTGDVLVQSHMLTFDNSSLVMRQSHINMVGGPGSTAKVRLVNGLHIAELGTCRVEGLGEFTIESAGSTGQLRVEDNATVEIEVGNEALGTAFNLPTGGRIGGAGPVILKGGGRFEWSGGTIGVATPAGPFDADVTNQGTAAVTAGTVSGPTSVFTNDAAGLVTQTAGILSLTSGGGIVNRGIWRFISPSAVIGVTGVNNPPFVNEAGGTITVQTVLGASSASTHTAAFTNRGLVHVLQGTFSVPNPTGVVAGVLTEGTWVVNTPGAALQFPGHPVSAIGGNASVTGNGASCPDLHPQTNHGHLTCNGNWGSPSNFSNTGALTCNLGTFTSPGNFTNTAGTCTLNEGTTCSVGGNCVNTGEDADFDCHGGTCQVEGDFDNGQSGQSILSFAGDAPTTPTVAGGAPIAGGFVCANFNNNSGGVIRPGGPLAPGPFRITGNFHQFAGGRIQIELGGATPVVLYDQVIVTGNAALGGLVEVSFLPPFTPTTGQQFTILTATGGTITGQFSQVTGPGQFSLSYSPTGVALTFNGPAPPGDLSGDGVVNTIDLGILLSGWSIPLTAPACGGALPCAADINHDGFVNSVDLGILLSSWTL